MRLIFLKSGKFKPDFGVMKKYLFKQDGLSLIEVLASVVLVTIVLTTFFSYFIQASTFSSKNEEKLVAYNLTSQTLSIIKDSFQNTLPQNDITTINCSKYPNGYPQALQIALHKSSCFYSKNKKNYYPEITIKRQTSSQYADIGSTPLYVVHIKIYNTDNPLDQKLFSETFGYIRGR